MPDGAPVDVVVIAAACAADAHTSSVPATDDAVFVVVVDAAAPHGPEDGLAACVDARSVRGGRGHQ